MRILLISVVIVGTAVLSAGLARAEIVSQEEELITEPIWEKAGWKKDRDPPTVTPVPEVTNNLPSIKKYSLFSEAGSAAGRRSPTGHKLKAESAFRDEELMTEPLWESGKAGEDQAESLRSFTARLDRRKAHLDESFTLTLEIIAPELKKISSWGQPLLPGFDIINTYQSDAMTKLDGRIWKVRTKRTVFLAREPGTYNIPPVKVRYRGQWYRTQELKITIEGSRSGYVYQRRGLGRKYNRRAVKSSAPDIEQRGSQEPGFTARISHQEVYVNQQLILTVSWHYRTGDKTKINYQPPSLTGFLIEALPQRKIEERTLGVSQRYMGRVYRTALFPVRAGTLVIGPARVTLTEQGKTRAYTTEPLTVAVKPLPRDPAPLRRGIGNGLVGNYKLQAELEAGRTEVEVPVRLKVTLSGRGNVRMAPAPGWKEEAHYRLYLEATSERISREGDQLEGQRTYGYQVIFPFPGRARLSSAVMRYFDPEQEQWRTATARIPEIEVLPFSQVQGGGEKSQPLAMHLKPNHSRPVRLRPSRPGMVESRFFWLIQAMGLGAILLVWGGRRLYSRAQPDPKALRIRRAYPKAKQSLRHLRRYIRQGRADKFYTGLTRITSEYLAAKFGLASAYVGAERLPEYFEQYNIPADLRLRFKAALTACEYVRYAAVTLPAKDMRLLHRDLKRAIREFEKIWRTTHKNNHGLPKKSALAVGITLLAMGTAYAGEAEKYFLRGNALARVGRYEEAETAYRKVLESKIKHPALYYNLGNAYLRQGKTGPAILAYERGLHRAPRNRDIKHNLKQAARWVKENGFSGSWSGFKRPLIFLYRSFTVNELAVTASLSYFLAVIIISLIILWPRRFRSRRPWLLIFIIIFLTAGLWAGARHGERYWWKRAVIMIPEVKLFVRPYREAEAISLLGEGTRVVVRREEEAWVEVRFGRQGHGWVQRSTLEFIK